MVLEAQASGIPVIVTDQGGPAENVIPEKTGLVVKGNCVHAILSAMESLAADPRRRSKMGQAAREYMEDRSFETAFNETWKMFGTLNADKTAMAG